MKINRQKELKNYIKENKSVSNEDMMKHFNVSIQTLRRDLKILEEENYIQKVYGGVVYNESKSMREVNSLSTRQQQFAEEKEYIGKLAAGLVKDNDVIFIDSGSTAYRMLHYMKNVQNVTVITHCLDVLNVIKDMPNITGICPGGTLMHNTGTILTDTTFYPYNYTKAFISTVGISVSRNLTNTQLEEGNMKSHVIQHAKETYIVADHSKFDVIAFNHFANLTQVHAVITDCRPPEKFIRFLENVQVSVIY